MAAGQPHDRLVKAVIGRPRGARAMLAAFLPAAVVRMLDLRSVRVESGTLVSGMLRQRDADLLLSTRVRGDRTPFYTLVEHKCRSERDTLLDLDDCTGRFRSAWRRAHPRRKPPRILPLLLHHGERPWSAPLTLGELLAGGAPFAAVTAPIDPTLPVVLVDLARRSDNELFAVDDPLTAAALWLLKHARRPGFMKRIAARAGMFGKVLRRQGAAALEVLLSYILLAARDLIDPLALGEVLEKHLGRQAKRIVMSTGEKLIEQGRQEGRQEGRKEIETSLRRVLRIRFGALPARQSGRLRRADGKTLLGWLERAATARSLDEVFGNGRQ